MAYREPMSDSPDDGRSDGDPGDGIDAPLNESQSDEAVIDEFLEERDLGDQSWQEEGKKYQCPECGAVHETRADDCRVCGWQAD